MRLFRCFLLLLLIPAALHAQEIINDIVAIVAETPITYLDLKNEIKNFKEKKKGDQRNIESKALDNLIDKAIIDSVLKAEVISIPESQVDEVIKKTMEDNNIKDEKTFEQILKKQVNLTLAEYKKELLNNLKMQQIAQLKIKIPTPKETEVQNWYNNHRQEIGNKYFLRTIKKAFNPNNPKEELTVSKQMGAARDEAIANFEKAVAKYSDNPANDGALGWLRIDELMTKDPTMANIAYRLKPGDVSMVFVSGNNYVLVKVDKINPISLEEATPLIMQRLYREKQDTAYEKWLEEKRTSSTVQIFMNNYQK